MVKTSEEHMFDELMKANVELQHKVVDLIASVKDLTKEVGSMVKLFKEAGENIKRGKYEDPLVAKLDELLDQNRKVAQGLLILENYIKEKQQTPTKPFPSPFPKAEERSEMQF